jgi:hypothetical protein
MGWTPRKEGEIPEQGFERKSLFVSVDMKGFTRCLLMTLTGARGTFSAER